jgi:isocitrate/isopropylmalate dehydrogenase
VAAAVASGVATKDLGGTASTTEFTSAVVDALKSA